MIGATEGTEIDLLNHWVLFVLQSHTQGCRSPLGV